MIEDPEPNTDDSFDDPQSVEKSILLLKSQSSDITTLPEGFNLHRMPQNYLNKRSYIEKIIFHATMSDALKSPFSGFTIANRYIGYLDSIDVISGIRSLKQLAKIALDPDQRTSVMVHRVGGTWLLNEFDIDSFLLVGERSRDWVWLREFLMKKKIYLCAEAFSRNSLILRDLYKKFLYHTVGHLPHLGLQTIASLSCGNEIVQKCLPFTESDSNSSLERSEEEECEHASSLEMNEFCTSPLIESVTQLDEIKQPVGSEPHVDSTPKPPWTVNPDEYLHMAKWKLRDLSFLVGSDLAIFGTHKHPCISLKLSPKHEAINVLTGVDIWLENILNEVPEVAMCYHHEGIVMQEYEIYKTCDLPSIAGFKTSQIYNTVQNLIMFLKRNATREGHTYWLVKEPGIDVVKLYDLTTMCDEDMMSGAANLQDDSDSTELDLNPFIMPVTTLCYRLAERRWREYRTLTEGCLQENDVFKQDLFSDELTTLTDALRLLRNCLDLITMVEISNNCDSTNSDFSFNSSMPTGLHDLKLRAVLLLCKLYLGTPTKVLNICIHRLRSNLTPGAEEVSLSVNELANAVKTECYPKSLEFSPNSNSSTLETSMEPGLLVTKCNGSKRRLLGSLLIKALQSSDTARLSHIAIGIIESCSISPSVANTSVLPSYSVQIHRSTDSIQPFTETSGHDLSDFVLIISTVKSCLCNAEELWSHFFPISEKSINVEELGCLLRYALSSVLLLEHLIPDQHTVIATTTSHNNFVCPQCGKAAQLDNQCSHCVDRGALINMLHIASCLLPAAVTCCVDVVRSPGFAADSLDSLSFRAKTADSVLLRLACSEAANNLEPLLNGAIYGAVDESKVIGFLKPSSDITIQWLEVLYISLRCLRRVLSTRSSPHSQANSFTVQPSKSSKPNPINMSRKLKKSQLISPATLQHHLITRLRVQVSWWPVLVNFYILGMRQAWLNGRSVQKALQISPHINGCLAFMHNAPLSVDELDDRLQIITYTNEFQCYKLAADLSDFDDSKPMWISHLRSLSSTSTPVLPNGVLVLRQLNEHEIQTGAFTTSPTDSTGCLALKSSASVVCLARAMDSILRCLVNMEREVSTNRLLHIQLCCSLLTTCNEYILHCLDHSDPSKSKKVDVSHLNLLRNIVKEIVRLLPPDLTTHPTPYSTDFCAPSLITKSLVPQLLDLRLHQMNIELRLHEQYTMQNGSRAQTPAWSTIVAHARTVFQWYTTQIVLPEVGAERLNRDVIQDVVMLIKWTSQLIALQSVNKDVLSQSGLITILKDAALVHPVLKILACHPDLDSASKEYESDLESSLRTLFYRVLLLCRTILGKQHIPIKPTRKSGGKQKADRHSTPAMMELVESVLSPDIIDTFDISSEEKFHASFHKTDYTTVESIISLLCKKTEILATLLS